MTKLSCKTEVVLAGRGRITLRPNDHVATGGEGSIYRKSNTIIKLYTDSKQMIRDNFVNKIKTLAQLQHKFIVAPKDLVFNRGGNPIGFYMPFVDGEPLPRVFTNDFRSRMGFGDDDASVLVDHMRSVVRFAHDNNVLLVDANEMNWIVQTSRKNGFEPRAIDVDSWAIGPWSAKVIMPSIRDWHTTRFDERTDWFAWGIVTFQIYAGIHPYKGKLAGYKSSEMEKRMKANASVFANGVRLNRAVRDFSAIPGPLLDWYFATFEKGERRLPPSPFNTGIAMAQVAKVLHMVNTKEGNLIFDKIYSGSDRVMRIFPCGVALLESGDLITLSNCCCISKNCNTNVEVICVGNNWLIADFVGKYIQCRFVNGISLQEEKLACATEFSKLVRYENRLFGVTKQGLTEVVVKVLNKPILSLGNTWGVLTKSTKWFDGVGVQDVMGAMYVIAPFGDNACAQVRVRELDGFRSIDARAGNRFVTIIAIDQGGEYQKFELTFNKTYHSYKIWQGTTDSSELNVAILPKGVCATIVDDGKLDIFVPSNGTLNAVVDKHITTDITLANWYDKVVYIKDGTLWQVRMK